MSKRTIYLNPCDVFSLTPLTTVNTIVINTLDYTSTNLATVSGQISVMLQGKEFSYVLFADIDNADNVGKFSINTSNQIVLVVDNTTVMTMDAARKYVWGIVVTYPMKSLKYVDQIPTYIMQSFTCNNYQVSQTIASDLPSLMNKMKCLDTVLDIDEAGFYYHILTRSMQ